MPVSGIAIALATQSGPRFLAVAITFVGTLKFIKWAAPFVCERLDKRAALLTARELAVEARFNSRLKHVEIELGRYRRATMMLLNAVAKINPSNPVLSDVAVILSKASPMTEPDPELDELLARAASAVETNQGGKQ